VEALTPREREEFARGRRHGLTAAGEEEGAGPHYRAGFREGVMERIAKPA